MANSASSHNVSILLNDGDGTYQPTVNYGTDDNPRSVFAVDLDGDGDIDLATANHGNGNVSIFINLTGPYYPYLPGDVNMANGLWPPALIGGDVTYLVNYFKGSPSSQSCLLDGFWCSADANGDCMVMGSDVVRMVAYFRGAGDIEYCADYEPQWHTPAELPPSAPSGWPNCE